MDPLSPRVADGGLATTLQRVGLAPYEPVNEWILAHPDRIRAVHQAFVDAGSDLLIAGSFRAMPSLDPRWERVGTEAVALARQAAANRPVWASLGPWTAPWSSLGVAEREKAIDAWSRAAAHLGPQVDGLLLETFVDLEAGLAALGSVKVHGPTVLSFVPATDGRLHDGSEPADVVAAARAAGAHAVGFNCGTAPSDVVRAVARSGADGLWARPAGSPEPEALARALDPVVDRCAVIGGCCGAGPEAIAALGALR